LAGHGAPDIFPLREDALLVRIDPDHEDVEADGGHGILLRQRLVIHLDLGEDDSLQYNQGPRHELIDHALALRVGHTPLEELLEVLQPNRVLLDDANLVDVAEQVAQLGLQRTLLLHQADQLGKAREVLFLLAALDLRFGQAIDDFGGQVLILLSVLMAALAASLVDMRMMFVLLTEE
jgi:hypothetical protein